MRLHNLVQSAGQIDIMPIDLVEFTSPGRLLVMGTVQQIAAVSSHLELTNLELITSPQRPTKIEGWLGKFSVEVDAKNFTVVY